MRTNRLHYLHQKPRQKLKFKSILLTFVAVIFLSACGIKGDLYQTPEQAVTTLDESQKQQAIQQPIEQKEQATGQSTEQVKEQQ